VVSEDDVVITSGCSGAVELAISVLLNEDDNLLVPRPGFPLYEVITNSLGGKVKHYNLLPSKDWECDLQHMASLIDGRTRAILINNPSNPCGSNYSKEHLEAIVAVASKYHLPIIADEIYGGCVFEGQFTAMFTVAGDVPVLSLGGLAKQFIVPGWRVGWVVIHDDKCRTRFTEIRSGLKSLSQLILGANSLVQTAIPRILAPEPGSHDQLQLEDFHRRYMSILKGNAQLCRELAASCPELTVVAPTGAMYCMIGVRLDRLDGILDDSDFAKKLLQEENLVLLPGQCFGMIGSLRIVTCPPREVLIEAFDRLKHFIGKHKINQTGEKRENNHLSLHVALDSNSSSRSRSNSISEHDRRKRRHHQ
jgi:tyrosine aminotransferase